MSANAKKIRFWIFTLRDHKSSFFLLDIIIIGINYHILRLLTDFWIIYELFQTLTLPKDWNFYRKTNLDV